MSLFSNDSQRTKGKRLDKQCVVLRKLLTNGGFNPLELLWEIVQSSQVEVIHFEHVNHLKNNPYIGVVSGLDE